MVISNDQISIKNTRKATFLPLYLPFYLKFNIIPTWDYLQLLFLIILFW